MSERQQDEDLDRPCRLRCPSSAAAEQPVEQCDGVVEGADRRVVDVLGEQQPGQRDVFVLGEVAQLVVNGDAPARRPAARRGEITACNVHAGGDGRDRARSDGE